MRTRKGFTIIELLVVVTVIAILIGIALPRMQGMRDEASLTRAKAELKTLKSGVESYYMNQSPPEYPPATDTLCESYLNDAVPLIVSNVLYDPFLSTAGGCGGPIEEYRYSLSSNGRYYVLFSLGLDREADITGISDAGVVQGVDDDDIYATNGTGF